MDFIDYNLNEDDCMIVALYNLALTAGKKIPYKKILSACEKKGWYSPGEGFNTDCVIKALALLGLKANAVPEQTTTKELWLSVVERNKAYLMLSPCPYRPNRPGHAMVATKGKKGVKLVNSVWSDCGWKTVSKDIRKGIISVWALEITRQT